MTDIAYLGLGIMGSGMVRNLLQAGHRVTAWNRTDRPLPDEITGAAGFSRAPSIAASVTGRDRVIACLTGPDAQRDVFFGDDGVLAHAPSGALIVDSTTTDPHLTAELGRAANDKGLVYMDCPVFGSRNEAWNGALDFVCGAPTAAFETIRPMLEPCANSLHHLGDVGAGAAMKLVGNLLVAAQMMSLGEGLSLARKAGLDADKVMGALDVVDFSSPLIRGVGRASFAGDFSPHFYLKHMLKDARLIGEYARSQSGPAPATAVTEQRDQSALNAGLGELNASGLHKLMFRLSGLDPE